MEHFGWTWREFIDETPEGVQSLALAYVDLRLRDADGESVEQEQPHDDAE